MTNSQQQMLLLSPVSLLYLNPNSVLIVFSVVKSDLVKSDIFIYFLISRHERKSNALISKFLLTTYLLPKCFFYDLTKGK